MAKRDSLASLSTAELLQQAQAAAEKDKEGDSPHRWRMVHELRNRPEPEVLHAALAWLEGESAAERALGAEVLAKLGGEELPFEEQSLEPLLNLLDDAHEAVVQAAVLALGFHDLSGRVGRLKALVDHPSSHVRDSLAIALGPQADPVAVKLLVRLSADEDENVRNWATFGLGTASEADTPALRAALVARLEDENEEIRGEALVGLALRRDSRVLAPLKRELERTDAQPLALAVGAAKEMGLAELLPALQALKGEFTEDKALLREAIQACSG